MREATLRILRRVLITIAVATLVLVVGVEWVFPVAVSFISARKAPRVAGVVPTELKDKSVSQVPGSKLSYFGYEFEVPWKDLDDTQTELLPKDSSDKNRADLHFRSGLRFILTAVPPKEFEKTFSENTHTSLQDFEASFGNSDYGFLKTVYEFSPHKMHHWSLSSSVHAREGLLLILKSIIPSKAAESGIFYVDNQSYKGFQQGSPGARGTPIILDLYSDDGGIDLIILRTYSNDEEVVTQPGLNRIIKSLRRTSQKATLSLSSR
jgi:hypothetical protein